MKKVLESKKGPVKKPRYKLEAGMILTPDKEEVVFNLVEIDESCLRCNGNGCPECENIKWNIKD